MKEFASHHLQVNRRQRKRPPLFGRLLVYFDDLCCFSGQTFLKQHDYSGPVEQIPTSPAKVHIFSLSRMGYFNRPKWLRFEVLNPEITVHHETQSGKLTGA